MFLLCGHRATLYYMQLVFLTKMTAAETPATARYLGGLDVTTREDNSEEQPRPDRCWIPAGFPSAAKQRHRPRQTGSVCHLQVARLKMDEKGEQSCQEILE